jgi:peptidoglycan/xylan/chitin deacetylase (PgdA/CDA1 family)|tara:strand:- start:158 stop:586 length:429 start_codon:yes stop_codon:yes gene_type:complete
LPSQIREKITNKIFKKVFKSNEKNFSKKLYMNKNHIKEMFDNGMSFGSHGDNHLWWKYLSYNLQMKELKNSINFFKQIGVYNQNFSVCYPYGSFKSNSIDILKKCNVKFALTTELGSVNKNNVRHNSKLPRYDTNDFKKKLN